MDYKKKYLKAEVDKYTILVENEINTKENLKLLKHFLIEWCKMEYFIEDKSTYKNLSERETEIYKLILLGNTNAEIASACFISHNTVKKHISNILFKLGYKSRGELIAKRLQKDK